MRVEECGDEVSEAYDGAAATTAYLGCRHALSAAGLRI